MSVSAISWAEQVGHPSSTWVSLLKGWNHETGMTWDMLPKLICSIVGHALAR